MVKAYFSPQPELLTLWMMSGAEIRSYLPDWVNDLEQPLLVLDRDGDQGGCVAMVPRGVVRTPKQRQGQLVLCCVGVSETSSPIVAAIRHLPRALTWSGDVESGESVGGSLWAMAMVIMESGRVERGSRCRLFRNSMRAVWQHGKWRRDCQAGGQESGRSGAW
jgi:hypothetical protein